MITSRHVVAVLLLLAAYGGLAQEQPAIDLDEPAQNAHAYRLGPGDLLQISAGPGAARHEAIVRAQPVGPDGRISFDLVGSVEVAGKTSDEIDAELTRLLGEFIIDVEVTVIVTTYKAKRVFVMGEVRRPGKYLIDEYMSIMDAINEAGTTTNSASLRKVKLIRSQSTAQQRDIQTVDFKQMVQKGELNRNLELADGDVIFVPTDAISRAGNFFDKIFKPLQPVVYIGVITGLWRLSR